MSKSQIGKSKVDRHNLSFDESDWNEFKSVSKDLQIPKDEVSALFRAFLRLYQKHYAIIKPMLDVVIQENDRIYTEGKQTLADKIMKKVLK